MNGMILPVALPARPGLKPNYWTEESPPFTQRSTASFGHDFGSITLNVKIDAGIENMRAALKYIVGYSYTLPIFDPANPSQQGPFRLSRVNPARHPWLPNLRATKILSVTGEGKRQTQGRGALIALPNKAGAGPGGGTGYYGEYQFAYLSILFEVPKYTILTDLENQSTDPNAPVIAGIRPAAEYRRHTEFIPDESLETLARKGETWQFLDTAARLVTAQSVGDKMIRQAKGALKVVTYDVAADYVFLGRMIPSNGLHRLSTLNSRPFPVEGYRDQSQAGIVFSQFAPGTLLTLPSKYPTTAQLNPAVINGDITADLFPRSINLERNFLFFDPRPCNTQVTVQLDNVQMGLPPNVPQAPAIKVRGHNLVPLPRPAADGSSWFPIARTNNVQIWRPGVFYALTSLVKMTSDSTVLYICIRQHTSSSVANDPNGSPTADGSTAWTTAPPTLTLALPDDSTLLYPYADTEALWKCAEKM